MNKRVLFVIPYLYEGGAQRALSNIEMHFPDDWEIDTLVNSDYKKAFPVKGGVISLGIEKKPRTSSPLFQFGVFLKRIRVLRELKKNGNYDACISFSDSASVANILSGKKYCKTIVSVRVSLIASNKLLQYKYIVTPLARLLYVYADKVVSVSEELKNELIYEIGIKKEKVVVIQNGYDIKRILDLAEEPIDESIADKLKGKRVICNVGRLSIQKGQGHLIRAFKMVHDTNQDTVLLIAGEGEQEEYLKDLITKLKLEESILMLGHLNNVYKYLKVASIFAFPSLFEGFPNALAEAICLGIPCVVSDFKTGAREIIAPSLLTSNKTIMEAQECEYGMLTPLCSSKLYKYDEPLDLSEQELANAIIRILSDKDAAEKLSLKSRIRSENLDIENAVQRWISVISENSDMDFDTNL